MEIPEITIKLMFDKVESLEKQVLRLHTKRPARCKLYGIKNSLCGAACHNAPDCNARLEGLRMRTRPPEHFNIFKVEML